MAVRETRKTATDKLIEQRLKKYFSNALASSGWRKQKTDVQNLMDQMHCDSEHDGEECTDTENDTDNLNDIEDN